MHVDSDDIQIDSTNQYAVCVEKVKENDSKQKIHQTKKVPMSCFGDFNNMSRAMLVKNLKLFQLNTNGSRNVLRKRLEMYNNKAIITEIKMFDYYVVIDYEATCDANQKNFDNNNQEIIEFSAVLLNCHTGEVEAEFQSYCRPVINPLLTKYCIELTGITQKVVDKSPLFHEVLASFDNWLQNKKLGSDYSFAIVTDGSKDIGHFLKRQSVLSQMDFPEYCKYWINIRKTFANFYQTNDLQYLARLANETVLSTMIQEIGYKFQGKTHSGLDDARNITFVAQRLLQDGASLIFNEKLFDENTRKKENCKTSFSTPVSKAEFLNIRGTFKPNFPTKSLVTSKTPDRETVTRTVGKDVLVKACHRETKAQTLVKGVVKMPPVESNSANGASIKTKAKKSLHPTKDIVKISTKQNQAKHPSKGSVDKTVIQMEIKNMSTEDSLMKTSSEEITTSTFFSPTQASVKRPPGKSIAKIPETSAQNSKTAYDIKQELMLAKKKMYCTSELIPSKKRTQLKKHLEDLKKLLKAARSREEQSVLATKLDLSEKKEFKVTETTSGSKSNNCQLVMKRSSKVKVGKKLKSELNHLETVINTESNLPFNSTRGISVLDGNRNIGNFVDSIAEEERLFFVDFENVLTMNSGYP